MVVSLQDLDAHEQPSEALRAEFKTFSRAEPKELYLDPRLDDVSKPISETGFVQKGSISASQIKDVLRELRIEEEEKEQEDNTQDIPILYHPLLPGLLILPSLVSPQTQIHLLNTILHRDMPHEQHQTNMNLHWNVPTTTKSLFAYPPDEVAFLPKNPSVHKPLTVSQVLNKKLHWVTLGGQYDWTNRNYPEADNPPFPPDLKRYLSGLFPATKPEAAIVNFYGAGDSMMLHRDVSEETPKGLISLSFGCDGLFMIAPSETPGGDKEGEAEAKKVTGKGYLLLRLRSGDAIYMTEESRYAWHGVPKVLKGSCPEYLADWPAIGEKGSEYEAWKGWMRNKRVNLNVRQMRE